MKNQKPWCKIFEVEGTQVLYRLTVNSEEEENETEIAMTVFLDGLEATSNVGGFKRNNTTAEREFEKIDENTARRYLETMKKLLFKNPL